MVDSVAQPPRRPGRFKRLFSRYPFLPALVIVLVLLALNGLYQPRSVGLVGISGLVKTYLALMMLAVAQTYVVYAGDIDLSAGAIVSLVNVVIVVLMEQWGGSGFSVIGAIIVGLGVGLACGLINGLVVAALRLQAIVATFATSIFFTGAALWVMPVAGTPAPAAFWRTYGARYLEIPFVFYAAIVLALVLYVLTRTRLTTQLLAVGDDAQAAFQSGLPVTAIRMKGYAIAGMFAALAAFCVAGDTASGDPLVGGKMTLFSVAAVVLGGSALAGGFGTLTGSVLGALIIGLISSLVYFVGTPSEWQNLVQGLAILVALMAGILIGRRARMNAAVDFVKQPLVVALILIVALLALGEALSPGFASLQQITRLLIVAALLGIVAAGQNLVILGGREGIDLSVGGVVSLAAIVAGNMMNGADSGIPLAILACIATGALFGLVNGLGVTLLRIPPLVMTLGMLGVLQGLLVVIRNGIPSGRAAPGLSQFVTQPFLLGLPGIIWLWVLVGLSMAFLLGRTVFGHRIYAIGSNEQAAHMAGVPVKTIRVALFVLSGVFAALAGLCLIGYSGSSFSNVGEQYMLPSIIAVVLGGTSLAGGKGGYTGTMAGAVMLTVLQSILTTVNIDESGRQMIFGATLLVLMLFYGRGRAMRA